MSGRDERKGLFLEKKYCYVTIKHSRRSSQGSLRTVPKIDGYNIPKCKFYKRLAKSKISKGRVPYWAPASWVVSLHATRIIHAPRNIPCKPVRSGDVNVCDPESWLPGWEEFIERIYGKREKEVKSMEKQEGMKSFCWYGYDLSFFGISPFSDPKTFMHTVASIDKRTVFEYYPLTKAVKTVDGQILNIFSLIGAEIPDLFLSYDDRNSETDIRAFYVSDDSYMAVQITDGKDCTLNLLSFDEKTIEKVKKIFTENTTEDTADDKSPIYIFGADKQGFNLRYAGDALESAEAADLIKENYEEVINSSFDAICDEFGSANPQGRIAIFHGPAGTGKTYMIRSLIARLKQKVKTIFVPPDSFSRLASPDFISLLLDEKEKGKPYLIVLEDADACLAPRAADNMHSISSILNFSDGILGGILDVRIVATTNAETDQFEPAIMRPGRLCEIVYLRERNRNDAQKIYNRLVKTEENLPPGNSFSLAQIYELADKVRKNRKPIVKQKRTFGF